jgi:hypothetical protein
MAPNPPWATKIVADTYGSLRGQGIPARWMPRLQDMVPIGGDGVEASIREYGCGAYGCVYPTLDDKVVLKLTADDTEAEFAANLAPTLERPICVRYYTVSRPEGAVDKKGSQVYLLWRESADYVGKISEFLDETTGDEDKGDEAHDLISKQHQAAQLAYRAINGEIGGGRPHEVMRRSIAAWLETCEAMARQTKVPELRELGDGLVEVYRAQQIFFGDIHAGNLGLVHRPDGDHWVITDPGHVAVVDL